MATETKKVSKLDTVLNKIDAFFESLMSSKKADDMEEDDDMGAEDDEAKKAETVEAPAAAKKAKKATDDEDSQDPDDDDDDDTDDDDKEMKKASAEIVALKATIAKQNALLKEAKTQLAQKDEDVREEIKSTFKPEGSQRSTKTSAVKTELPSWATPKTEMAQRAAKLASAKK